METTTNYELKKYQSGDLFNPLTVNNPNLDDIDADMKAISDRAIGRATELVSQGVHAITLLDTDCKTFKFVATGNYSAGETFTVNGIQANAYTPSGSALTSNAFVTGSIVLGTLNEDGTAITFYVTGSAVSDDSLKLGGELPSYYATQSDMTSAETDITNLKNQAGNTSIAGIGDGTLSGAVSSLNNDLTDNGETFRYGYNPQTGERGYYIESGGADTFVPFKIGRFVAFWLINTFHIIDLEDGTIYYNLNSVPSKFSAYIDSFNTNSNGYGIKFKNGTTLEGVYHRINYSGGYYNELVKVNKITLSNDTLYTSGNNGSVNASLSGTFVVF